MDVKDKQKKSKPKKVEPTLGYCGRRRFWLAWRRRVQRRALRTGYIWSIQSYADIKERRNLLQSRRSLMTVHQQNEQHLQDVTPLRRSQRLLTTQRRHTCPCRLRQQGSSSQSSQSGHQGLATQRGQPSQSGHQGLATQRGQPSQSGHQGLATQRGQPSQSGHQGLATQRGQPSQSRQQRQSRQQGQSSQSRHQGQQRQSNQSRQQAQQRRQGQSRQQELAEKRLSIQFLLDDLYDSDFEY